jgi:hypothetical protein
VRHHVYVTRRSLRYLGSAAESGRSQDMNERWMFIQRERNFNMITRRKWSQNESSHAPQNAQLTHSSTGDQRSAE